jgi:predicted nucleic acid-binding protein
MISPQVAATSSPVCQSSRKCFRASAMLAWACVDSPLDEQVMDRAVLIYRQARRAGLTIRSSVDCLIAASALRHGLTIVHCDRDFEAIARVTGLRHHDLSARLR